MAHLVTVTRLTTKLQVRDEQTFEATSVIVADNGRLDLATPDGPVLFEDSSWASVKITATWGADRGERRGAATGLWAVLGRPERG